MRHRRHSCAGIRKVSWSFVVWNVRQVTVREANGRNKAQARAKTRCSRAVGAGRWGLDIRQMNKWRQLLKEGSGCFGGCGLFVWYEGRWDLGRLEMQQARLRGRLRLWRLEMMADWAAVAPADPIDGGALVGAGCFCIFGLVAISIGTWCCLESSGKACCFELALPCDPRR